MFHFDVGCVVFRLAFGRIGVISAQKFAKQIQSALHQLTHVRVYFATAVKMRSSDYLLRLPVDSSSLSDSSSSRLRDLTDVGRGRESASVSSLRSVLNASGGICTTDRISINSLLTAKRSH